MDDIFIGIFILKTAARPPEIVKNAILFSTAWEYDRMRGWNKPFEDETKENLKKISRSNHKP